MALSFVDIHAHILHGIDDGARDREESIAIAGKAWADGAKAVVATPHYSLDIRSSYLDIVADRFNDLKSALAGKGPELVLGAEVLLEVGLPQFVKKEKRITLGGMGRHILVEMPLSGIPPYAQSVVFELLTNNVIPIWAHPERCPDVMEDFRAVKPFVDNGMLLQINAGSLLGAYGRTAKGAAKKLVENGFGHCIASDTHRYNNSVSPMAEAALCIEKLVGAGRAEDMAFIRPRGMLG